MAQRVRPAGRGVPQALERPVDDGARLAHPQPAAARAEEEGGAGVRPGQAGATEPLPRLEGAARGCAVGDGALPVSLAGQPDDAAAGLEVVHVQGGEFGHPGAGGVEQLEQGGVPQGQRVGGRVVARGGGVHTLLGSREEPGRLLLLEHVGQRPLGSGRAQPQGGVVRAQALPAQPGREGADGGHPAGQGRAGEAGPAHGRQPAAQVLDVQLGEDVRCAGRVAGGGVVVHGGRRRGAGCAGDVVDEGAQIGEVRAHGLGAAVPLVAQVLLERLEPGRVPGRGGARDRDRTDGGRRGHPPTLPSAPRATRPEVMRAATGPRPVRPGPPAAAGTGRPGRWAARARR